MKYLDYDTVSYFDPRIVAWTSEGNNVWTRHGPFSVVVLPAAAQRQRPGDLQARCDTMSHGQTGKNVLISE